MSIMQASHSLTTPESVSAQLTLDIFISKMLTYLLLIFTVCLINNIKVNAEYTIEDGTGSSTDKLVHRILEGEVSNETEYRYHVSIMRLENGIPILTCGGAIINRRYVLTAAHCVIDLTSPDLIVRHGGVCESSRTSSQDKKRYFYQVVKTYVPRMYSSLPCRKHHHDIAILKVAQAFDLGDFVHYAKVNLPEFDADYEDQVATLTGYGPDYAPIDEYPGKAGYLQYVTELRAMHTTVISNEDCQYEATVVLTEGSLCAKALNPASQSCFEDDGGPLVRDGTIIGILNERRCDFKKPELFTRVSTYLHFIKTVLEHQLSYDVLVL